MGEIRQRFFATAIHLHHGSSSRHSRVSSSIEFLSTTCPGYIYICTYIYLYVHIYISREIRECRRGLLIPREKGDGESYLSVSYLCVYACVCVRMCDRAGNRIKKGRSFRERDRIRACDSQVDALNLITLTSIIVQKKHFLSVSFT